MLKKETWQDIAKRTGLEAEKLQEAIASEQEEDVILSDVTVFNDAELEDFKESIGRSSAKTGAKTIVEMEVKSLRKKHGIDFEGKSIEDLMSAYAKKQVADAKIEPNKKVADALESVKNIQNTYNTDIGLKDTEISQLKGIIQDFKTNGELTNHIPDGLSGIDSKDFLTIAKTKASFGYDDEGNFVVKKGDKIIKDKMEKPINPKDWLTDLAIEKKWIESNGRGGDNELGGNKSKYKTMNDVFKFMEDNKISPQSPEGEKMINDFNNLKT